MSTNMHHIQYINTITPAIFSVNYKLNWSLKRNKRYDDGEMQQKGKNQGRTMMGNLNTDEGHDFSSVLLGEPHT